MLLFNFSCFLSAYDYLGWFNLTQIPFVYCFPNGCKKKHTHIYIYIYASLHDFSRFCLQTFIFTFDSYTCFPYPYVCVCVFVCVSLVRWLWLCSIKHRAGYSDVLSSLSLSLFSLRHCAAISLSLLPSNNMSSLLHCSDSTVKLMRTNSSACVSLTFLISALLSCSPPAISLRKARSSSTRLLSVHVYVCE